MICLSSFLHPFFSPQSPHHRYLSLVATNDIRLTFLLLLLATSHCIFICYSRLQRTKLSSSIWAVTYVFLSKVYSSTKRGVTVLWNPNHEESVVVWIEGVSRVTLSKKGEVEKLSVTQGLCHIEVHLWKFSSFHSALKWHGSARPRRPNRNNAYKEKPRILQDNYTQHFWKGHIL